MTDRYESMKTDEALLRQALEALEQIVTDFPWELTGLLADTIAALRERLGAAITPWASECEVALRASGWQEGEDPTTEGLYVVRDSKGNVEVGMWYARTLNGQPAEWSKEFRDVDRDDIVAWIRIPPYVRAAAAIGEAMP